MLSTLHTNSAAESLLRLEDMGVARYLLAKALLMIRAEASAEELLACAEAEGMQSLFASGVRLAAGGETSLGEVRRCLTDAR